MNKYIEVDNSSYDVCGDLVDDIMKKKIEVVELAPQWDKLAKRMRPTHRIIEQAKVRVTKYNNGKIIDSYTEYRPQQLEMYHETHFSPDEEIAKFLHTIEEVLGYSLPVNVDTRQLQLSIVADEIEKGCEKIGWGFQAHADFNNWWQDLEDFKKTKFFDYSETFEEIQIIKMPDSAYYETDELLNGKEICEAIKDAPIFNLLVVYPNKVKPLFDYYMDNIWYPEHALSWIASVDPSAINKLQEATLKTTKSKLRRLPVNFLKSLQATLPKTPKQQALR